MERVTTKDLENLVESINEKVGFDEKPAYNTVGAYQLDWAYGGVKLVQVVSPGGGVKSISWLGYGTKREMYNFLKGFSLGLETSNK